MRNISRLDELSKLKRGALWSNLAQARQILIRRDSTYTILSKRDKTRLNEFDSPKVRN